MTLIINGKTYEAGELIAYVQKLEKENAELKEINTHTLSQLNLDNGELIIENEKLKKENTELKHTIAELRRDKDNLNMHIKAQEKLSEYRSDKLTKAKELIKDLLGCLYSVEYYRVSDLEEAEQFLRNDGCPDVMCEDCTKEDCGIRQLGLVEVEK